MWRLGNIQDSYYTWKEAKEGRFGEELLEAAVLLRQRTAQPQPDRKQI